MSKISLFNTVVKRFGFLKDIPLLPHVFDAGLKMWSVLNSSKVPDYIDSLQAELSMWDSVTFSIHKYGGLQFNCYGKEIGHIHSNGLLDIRFSKAIKAKLLLENRIQDHHVFNNSGWISFYICNTEDKEYAIKLLRMAHSNIALTILKPVKANVWSLFRPVSNYRDDHFF